MNKNWEGGKEMEKENRFCRLLIRKMKKSVVPKMAQTNSKNKLY